MTLARISGIHWTAAILALVCVDAAPKEVVDELAKIAIPLTTLEAGQGFADLQPLKEIVGSARVVSLGDAAPGAREIFQANRRVFEFLVSEMGFSVLAIEAGWPESLPLNEYVLHGTGDPKAALAGLHAPAWNTEEALDLVQWMRKWNADEKHAKKIELLGFDMQYARLAYQQAQAYLTKVDEESAQRMGIVLAAFRQVDNQGRPRYASLEPDMRNASHVAIQDFLSLLEDTKEIYIKRSSAAEWSLAKQSAVILSQSEEMMGAESAAESTRVREHSMAHNIVWLLAQSPAGTRMVVWAHDAHVRGEFVRGEKDSEHRNMGSYLRERIGKDGVVLGSAFDQGSFLAQDGGVVERTPNPSPATHAGPSAEDTVEAALARTKLPLAVFAFARLPKDGAAAKWLGAPQTMREVGAAATDEQGMLVHVTPSRAYDALIYVERTTSAHPLPKIESKEK